MSAVELLAELGAAGITVTRDGDHLRVRAEPGVTLAPYVERIRAGKPALLAELLKTEIMATLDVDAAAFDGPLSQLLLALCAALDEYPSEPYWGCCPVCGDGGMSYDIHPRGDVYEACDEHRIAWAIGNATGSLKDAARYGAIAWDDVERMAAENRARLSGYRIIDIDEATRRARGADGESRPRDHDVRF